MTYDDVYYNARAMFEMRAMDLPGGCNRLPMWQEQQFSPLARMSYETVRTSPYLRGQVNGGCTCPICMKQR